MCWRKFGYERVIKKHSRSKNEELILKNAGEIEMWQSIDFTVG